MKWNLLFSGLLAGSFLCASPLVAQESVAAAAEREEMEANFKRMNSRVEQLEETLQSQQKRMADMIAEIRSLHEQVDKLKAKGESTATQESIKQLAEKIEEVDKKRLADNESITRKLTGLGKELSTTLTPKVVTPPPAVKPDKPAVADPSLPPEKSFEYKIKDGDTLSRIVTDLRAQGWKVTQKQVMDINPSVNWGKLRIGQTVYIPQPAK
jgi:TolA-binding protein